MIIFGNEFFFSKIITDFTDCIFGLRSHFDFIFHDCPSVSADDDVHEMD